MQFQIITPCKSTKHLLTIKENIFQKNVNVKWRIIFNTTILKDVNVELLEKLKDENTFFYFEKNTAFKNINHIVKECKDGWIYFLYDNNTLGKNFYGTLLQEVTNRTRYDMVVFNQFVNGKDFSGLEYRIANPENTVFGKVDISQVLFNQKIFNVLNYLFEGPCGGRLVAKIYEENKKNVNWINKTISNFKYLDKAGEAKVPKILYIGNDRPLLETKKIQGHASNLNVKYIHENKNIVKTVSEFKPDLIYAQHDFKNEGTFKYLEITNLPNEIVKKVLIGNHSKEKIGQIVYDTSMEKMLSKNNLEDDKTISFFTPIYNTGDKLRKTYESLKNQTYKNWEWVIVNDSTDEGYTLKIAEDIAKNDIRVKVYDFREKSGGCIGDVKYKACCLAKGYILAELDHDDLLTENCAMDLHKAAQKHPECGFFFTDWVELYENWSSSRYDGGVDKKKSWAFGYGSYRQEMYNGHLLNVAEQHNFNPKTIRHIVGIPNHIRAWRRTTYFEIGGHNRNLTVADDYELCIRTWLHTQICKIPKLGYLQLIYNNSGVQNTHNLSRGDIQRRVLSIAKFYNIQIKNRFEELGYTDWAYEHNPEAPLTAPSKFGEDENYTNIIYSEEN